MTLPDSEPALRRIPRQLGWSLVSRLVATTQRARRSQFRSLASPESRIVLLGDSITEQGLWEEWLPDLPTLNRGIGGETSAQVLDRLESAVNHPLAVSLLIGTNDLSAGRPRTEILNNVARILDGIERLAPGTPVILNSVMPRTSAFRTVLSALNQDLAPLVTARSNVEYLDLWPALADAKGELRAEFTEDHLHLNGPGYAAWVAVLSPRLRARAVSS